MLFKKKVLSSSVALALVGSAMPALAQEEGLEIEEVIVEGGIRASLKKSMDLKRDTVGVADAISAEDMGKFPDTNLAEALQRITGVSIDRARGEGSKVTVRGFGPEYNMVTLNGRQMPTHSGSSRSFDFADLASEGIAAVVVHKTGDASAPSGGIGSLINIKTTRPLEAGTVATLGVKAGIDTSTVTGNTATPEIAGLFSETFADDTVGVSLSFSAQERNNAVNTAQVGGYFTHPGDIADATFVDWKDQSFPDLAYPNMDNSYRQGQIDKAVPYNENQVNRPSAGNQTTSIPQNLTYNLSEYVSNRLNGQLTLQWRPLDEVTATVDYTYSELDLERTYNDLSAWFNQGAREQHSSWDDNNMSTPISYIEYPVDNDQGSYNSDFPMGIGRDGSKNRNNSVGLNLEWNVNDSLQLTLDHHESTAKAGANSPYGTFSLITIASFNRAVTAAYFDEENLPILELGMNPEDPSLVADGGTDRLLYKNDMVITGSSFRNAKSEMEIEQTKLGGTFDLSDLTSIDFGVEILEVANRDLYNNVDRASWGGLTAPGDISHILTRSSMADSFDQVPGGDDPRRQTEFFTTTLEELIEVANQEPLASTEPVGDCGTPYCLSTKWIENRYAVEETTSVFGQLTHDTEVNEMPLNIRVGLRYEQTEVTSPAKVPVYESVSWEGGNEYLVHVKEELNEATGNMEVVMEEQSFEGDYNLFLPNLDLNLEITDSLVARASISKTVTRPNYRDIQGGTTVSGSTHRFRNYSAAGGSPDLDPIKSANFDISLEWYYGESDYISFGYYEKTVDNFIANKIRKEALFGLTDPTKGGLYKEIVDTNASISDTDTAAVWEVIEGYNQDTIDANPVLSREDGNTYLHATAESGNDSIIFDVSGPVNERTSKAHGYELNLQHNFGESGFGVILNKTWAYADAEYDPNTAYESQETDLGTTLVPVEQFALGGLSDSANFIGFYDKDGINVRIAYNWRDDFFAGIGQDQGSRSLNPNHTQEYGQWDISASYEINDNLTIFMDGINVNEEYFKTYGRVKSQALVMGQTGARYNLGLRYTF